ncbi:MAG: DUF3098 domain-containing protein [Bacteroidia bacterium]|nr:DUF3098 domain-containing protein [Bacteroidia bacterium]
MATQNKRKSTDSGKEKYKFQMTFGKENYRWMLIGLAIIAIGFILMVGNTDDIFNNAEVFETGEKSFSSTVKVTIAPIVVLLGFAVEVYSIFVKSSKSEDEPS